MSAFVVSNVTVNRVATAIVEMIEQNASETRRTELANMLMNGNEASVAYRYRETMAEVDDSFEFEYQFESFEVLLVACKCWLYQSCELPAVENSEIFSLVSQAEKLLIGLTGEVEYGAPKWEAAFKKAWR